MTLCLRINWPDGTSTDLWGHNNVSGEIFRPRYYFFQITLDGHLCQLDFLKVKVGLASNGCYNYDISSLLMEQKDYKLLPT